MGPFVDSEGKKKYILVLMDLFSKFAEFVPIENKTAEEVAKAIFQTWILRWGWFSTWLSDMGKEFDNSVLKEVWALGGVESRMSSAFVSRGTGGSLCTNYDRSFRWRSR